MKILSLKTWFEHLFCLVNILYLLYISFQLIFTFLNNENIIIEIKQYKLLSGQQSQYTSTAALLVCELHRDRDDAISLSFYDFLKNISILFVIIKNPVINEYTNKIWGRSS